MSKKSSLYTKTGDSGETSILGKRLKKSAQRIRAIGTVDELNSSLGLALAQTKNKTILSFGERIQNELFNIGATLANPNNIKMEDVPALTEENVAQVEEIIDSLDSLVEPIRNFILPGGSLAAASFHQTRAVCRRAEREIVILTEGENINPFILKYLNRLSDLFFTIARYLNKESGNKDRAWRKT